MEDDECAAAQCQYTEDPLVIADLADKQRYFFCGTGGLWEAGGDEGGVCSQAEKDCYDCYCYDTVCAPQEPYKVGTPSGGVYERRAWGVCNCRCMVCTKASRNSGWRTT